LSIAFSKPNSFVDEIVLDQTILQPRTPERVSPRIDFDQQILQDFEKLQYLASNRDHALYKDHFQQFVDISALSIAAASVNPQVTQSISPNPASSTYFVTSQSII
jgi:hypothetical protein